LCVGLAICVFAGLLPLDPPERQRTFWHGLYFKRVLIWITAVYFVSGTTWMTLREKRKAKAAP
jgi:hypothetical protein